VDLNRTWWRYGFRTFGSRAVIEEKIVDPKDEPAIRVCGAPPRSSLRQQGIQPELTGVEPATRQRRKPPGVNLSERAATPVDFILGRVTDISSPNLSSTQQRQQAPLQRQSHRPACACLRHRRSVDRRSDHRRSVDRRSDHRRSVDRRSDHRRSVDRRSDHRRSMGPGATTEGTSAAGASSEGASNRGASAAGATAEGASNRGASAAGAAAEGAPNRGASALAEGASALAEGASTLAEGAAATRATAEGA
jgi:X-X-X-Leu-X-X-Gly heptad repeat protein